MEILIKFLIVAAIGLFIALFSRYVGKRPNRAQGNREKIRAPKLLAFVGWLFVVAGAVFTLASFATPTTSSGAPMPLGAKITAILVLVVGATFLYGYGRWYTILSADQVEFRRMFTPPSTIRYADIVEHSIWQQNSQWFLKIKSFDGTKMNLNITMFRAPALLAWLEFKDAVGRNPNSQELAEFQRTGTWPQGSKN